MTVHRLKTWQQYYADVKHLRKPFEIRRDDRTPPYKPGDLVCLEEWDHETEQYTGAWMPKKISFFWRGGCMPEGYVAFLIDDCTPEEAAACRMARKELEVSK